MGKIYICPMHSQIQKNHPGKCPICGMELIVKGSVDTTQAASYTPFIVVISMVTLVSFAVNLRPIFDLKNFIQYFMVGFFLVFSGFKLMDLQGFAQGYATYDILAKKWNTYGYVYPFLELFFGISMLIAPQNTVLLFAECVVMVFSGLGVALKLARHEKFQCACLGTFLKVPLTKVTLVEDFGMAALAILLLFWR